MNWLLALLGVVLIGVTIVDAVWTTLSTGGGGPVTDRLSNWLWRGVLFARNNGSSGRHGLLTMLGTLNLLMIIGIWILLLWTGWTLLFSADPGSVLNSATRQPANLTSRIYFTGYTIFTLGIGNFVPEGGFWEVLTAIASINGLFLITLAITYLLPVVSAAAQKRQLAAVVSDLGRTPEGIVLRAWNGRDFEGITNHFAQLVPLIEGHAERHAAYPILHYFHSPSRRAAASPNLAALDEALLLMTAGVEPDVRLPAVAIGPLQDALDGLLSVLQRQYIHDADEPPAVPDLGVLQKAGIPVVSMDAFRPAVARRSDHRRLFRGFVESDGWEWADVWSAERSDDDAAA